MRQRFHEHMVTVSYKFTTKAIGDVRKLDDTLCMGKGRIRRGLLGICGGGAGE